MIDCQQFEMYAVEACLPSLGRYAGAEEVQELFDSLRDTPWWQEHYPQVKRVEVYGHGRMKDSVGGWYPEMSAGKVEMGRWDRWTVVHELSHVLSRARYGEYAGGHGPWFARTYLELTYHILGSEAFTTLREAFEEGDIVHDPQEVAG